MHLGLTLNTLKLIEHLILNYIDLNIGENSAISLKSQLHQTRLNFYPQTPSIKVKEIKTSLFRLNLCN